jgi:hypothetical protein
MGNSLCCAASAKEDLGLTPKRRKSHPDNNFQDEAESFQNLKSRHLTQQYGPAMEGILSARGGSLLFGCGCAPSGCN